MLPLRRLIASARSRRVTETLGAGLLLALVTSVLFGPLTIHPRDVLVGTGRSGLNDLTAYFLADRDWRADWNPHRMTGLPHSSNPQAAWHYPPNWLAEWSSEPARWGWMMVVHHWLAGLGTYLLCRAYRIRHGGALVGALVMAAAPQLLVHTAEGHYTLVCAAAWYPWGLLAFERLRQGQRGGLTGVAAVLALCLLAGHAQLAFYLAAALTVWRMVDALLLVRRGKSREAGQALVQWAIIGLLSLQLAAVDVLPQWTFARVSNRGSGLSSESAGAIGIGWRNLLQLVYPAALGDAGSYRGPGLYFHETLCYFGVLPLLLAVIGLAANWKRSFVRSMALLAAVAFVFAAGANTPLFPLLFKVLPGVSLFRAPARALMLVALATSVLAAAGADALAAKLLRRANHAWHPRRLRPALIAVMFVLAASELCWFGATHVATVPTAALRSGSAVTKWLGEQPGEFRVAAPQTLLTDRESQAAGIDKLQAYEPVAPASIVAVIVGCADSDATPAEVDSLLGGFGRLALKLDRDVLDLLGVRYAVLPASHAPPGDGWIKRVAGVVNAPQHLRGVVPKQGRFAIHENTQALPRAFVVGRAQVAAGGADALAALRELDPREAVILSSDVLAQHVQDDEHADAEREAFHACQIVEYAPNRVVVSAQLERPGYLVVTDTWYPGWTARVDGTDAELLRADVAFRAVPLGPGRHEVVMSYEPRGFGVGRMLSAIALLGIALLGVLELRRGSRGGMPQAADQAELQQEPACKPNSST